MGKVYDVNGNVICEGGGVEPSYTDAECITAFMAEVNKKASSIGMSSSSFVSPAGDSSTTQTTAKDMALLTMIASGYKELAEVWGKDSYSIVPRNRTATITVSTTVKDTALESYYPVLGGKTGHYGSAMALGCVCNVEGKQVAGYIAGASTEAGRFTAMKELMDIAKTIINGGTNTDTVESANCAVAILVPTYYPMSYEQQTPVTLYSQNPNTMITPASTAKMITAVTVLDWVDDVNETFTIVASDQIGGSGAVFNTGDVVSFKDGLYALMLPSSNMIAHAFARVVGRKILTLGS